MLYLLILKLIEYRFGNKILNILLNYQNIKIYFKNYRIIYYKIKN